VIPLKENLAEKPVKPSVRRINFSGPAAVPDSVLQKNCMKSCVFGGDFSQGICESNMGGEVFLQMVVLYPTISMGLTPTKNDRFWGCEMGVPPFKETSKLNGSGGKS